MTENTQGSYYKASTRHLIQWVLVLACFLFISLQPQALQAQSPNPYLSDSYLEQYPDELQEQQPEPISRLSEKATITAALSRNQEKLTDEFESIILDNKAALESMDIVQLRVDQSVNRILGTNNQGTYIQSQPNELITLVKILDDGLFRYHQLNQAIARQEKDNTRPKNEQTPLYTGTVSQATAVFWKARGAKSADKLNRQVSKDTEKELEFFKKNRYSLDNEQSFKRDQVLLLISKLKLNKAKIENLYDELSMLAERPLVPLTELKFSNARKITVPELATSLDNHWGFVPNLFPETEAVEPEKFNTYLSRYSPGLDPDAEPLNDIELGRWLSVGKNVAFDLYNLLDRLERKRYLKQDDSAGLEPNTVVNTAKYLRVKLAYFSYQKQRGLFSLSHCERITTALHQAASQQLMTDDGSSSISELFNYEQSVKNTLNYYISYGQLQSAFIYLQNSLRLHPAANMPQGDLNEQVRRLTNWNRKNRSTDVFSCYQSDRQRAQQEEAVEKIRQEKQAALSHAAELQAKLDAIAEADRQKAEAIKKARSAWIRKQKSSHYTLLIKTGKTHQQLVNYARQHKLGNKAHVVTTLSYGKKLYKLLYGSYQNRELAYIDQFKLPEKVQMQNDIRTRRISTVQQKLPPLE